MKIDETEMELLRFVVASAHAGVVPSVEEMARHMGWASKNAVICRVRALAKKGVLRPSRGQRRSISFTHKGALAFLQQLGAAW